MGLDGITGAISSSVVNGGECKQPKVLAQVEKGSIWTQNTLIEKGKDKGRYDTSIQYKDFNGDGQITDDELYVINRYKYYEDGGYVIEQYWDKDGDGFSDVEALYSYSLGHYQTGKVIQKQEDIQKAREKDEKTKAQIQADISAGKPAPKGTLSKVELRRMENLITYNAASFYLKINQSDK